MSDLLYATTNVGKFQSLKRDLEKYDIGVTQSPLDIEEPRSSDVEEIAKHKVKYASKILGRENAVVVSDAGFYIPSLNGFPKAFVNFTLETIGLEGILRLVEGKDRDCEFRECLAYLDESLQKPRFFVGKVEGSLAIEPRGVVKDYHWSDLALVFVGKNSLKTLAEMEEDEYTYWRKVSRQNSPTNQLGRWLNER